MIKMTMKEALDLAIESALICSENENLDRKNGYKQAAAMLRDGGPVVEKSKRTRCYNDDCQFVPFTKTWTEHEKIEIVVEKSKPTFEEIKE